MKELKAPLLASFLDSPVNVASFKSFEEFEFKIYFERVIKNLSNNSTSILQGHYSLIVSKYGCFSNEASVIVKVVKCSTDLVLIHNVLSSKEHLENIKKI